MAAGGTGTGGRAMTSPVEQVLHACPTNLTRPDGYAVKVEDWGDGEIQVLLTTPDGLVSDHHRRLVGVDGWLEAVVCDVREYLRLDPFDLKPMGMWTLTHRMDSIHYGIGVTGPKAPYLIDPETGRRTPAGPKGDGIPVGRCRLYVQLRLVLCWVDDCLGDALCRLDLPLSAEVWGSDDRAVIACRGVRERFILTTDGTRLQVACPETGFTRVYTPRQRRYIERADVEAIGNMITIAFGVSPVS